MPYGVEQEPLLFMYEGFVMMFNCVLLQPSNIEGCGEEEGTNLLYKPRFGRTQHNELKWQYGKFKLILEKIANSKDEVLEYAACGEHKLSKLTSENRLAKCL